MEIIKLIKANIKHKKGAFKSIAALMTIIVVSFTVTVSNNDNIDKALANAHSVLATPDVTAFLIEGKTDRSIIDDIKENPDVTGISATDCVNSGKASVDGYQTYQMGMIYPDSYKVYRVLNENFNGYIENPEPLGEGEIYLPYSFTGL